MFKKIKLSDLPNYFYFGIKWNAFEVITYQIILILHQMILFYACKDITYGLIATVFSFIYLTIAILNLGLDKSLTTFFKTTTASKENFIRYFLYQLLLQILVVALLPSVIFFLAKLFGFGIPYLTNLDFILIFFILISESIRKTFRAFAQLAFLNNQTAILEIVSVIIYVLIFWLIYFIKGCADLTNALIPLLIESLISISILSLIINNIYNSIIDETADPKYPNLTFKEIVFNRFTIFANQLTSLTFSSNFILTVIAFRYGLKSVASLQLSKNVVNFLYLLLEKTFGITSGSLLTRVKDDSLEVKQNSYNLSVGSVYRSIAFILILVGLIFILLFFLFNDFLNFNFDKIMEGYLFAFAILSNTLFIPQEQLLIVEEKIYYLMFINVISAILYYLSLILLPLKITLIFFVSLRLLSLKSIITLTKAKLKLKTLFANIIGAVAVLMLFLSVGLLLNCL